MSDEPTPLSSVEAPASTPPLPPPAPAPEAVPARPRGLHGVGILVALLILSAIGIGVTDSSPERGFRYWMMMAPLFAAISLAVGWSSARQRGEGIVSVLRTQALHWLGLLLAVYLVFLLYNAGRLNNEAAGLVALLTLALTSFLAGVHFDWRFLLAGIVLGGATAGGAFVEQFLWTIALPVILMVALAIYWYLRRG